MSQSWQQVRIQNKKQHVESTVTIQVPRANTEGAKMVLPVSHSSYLSTS